MSNPFATPGLFSWVELMTTDPAAARKFYTQVFGWQYKGGDAGAGPYTEIQVGGKSIGGIMASPPGCPAPPSWNNYVTVADIDKIVSQVPKLSGSIAFGPKEIPGIGRFAVLRDPQGADLMPIQYSMKVPSDSGSDFNPHRTPGAFSWVELLTPDPDAAKKFYGQLFDWTFQKPGQFDYTIIKLGEEMVGGLMAMPPSGPPPSWGTYVTVTSADDVSAKTKAAGGKVLVDPQDIPTIGRFTVIQDPQGASITAMQWAPM